VIHLDVPYSPEAYLQETGRAGRNGRPVAATLPCAQADLDFAGTLGRQRYELEAAVTHGESSETPNIPPLAAERYAQMVGYALNTNRCRRELLLGFLGHEPESCGGCDVCNGRVLERPEGEEQLLRVFNRHRRRFTVRQAVQLLRGARSYEVVRGSLTSYRDFGLLSAWQEEEIEEALETLRCRGAIRVLTRGPWKDRITA
jgi:ATP-dependent DNA helicase RecQ